MITKRLERIRLYLSALVKWLAVALVTGAICGFVGTAFHIGVDKATELRTEYPWLLFTLPVLGIMIAGIYKILGTEGQNTNDIIDAAHFGKDLSIQLIPAIFIGTILTHLGGGSSGREGAALQMGGDIGHHVGKQVFRLGNRDLRIATMCGMAAFFSALFGTPLTAAVFAIMVISVGSFLHAAFVPCFTASITAYYVSLQLGVPPTHFNITVPDMTIVLLIKAAFLATLFAAVSVIFVEVLHQTEHLASGRLKNPYVRAVTGGVLIILITIISGTKDYNGAGMDVIARAVELGQAHPLAFVFKILLTSVTLSTGFRGGEVVPSFFIGATFGAVAAPLIGFPAGFGAALGLIGVFCGATNCMFSSIVLSIELFGAEGLIFFGLVCGISYMLSGYNGLYSSQTILFSKVKAQYLEVKTNHHHIGMPVGEDKASSLSDHFRH